LNAKRIYCEALHHAPKNPKLQINLGINKKRAGKFKEALDHYAACLELEP